MTIKADVIVKSAELVRKYDNILQKLLFDSGNRLETTTDKDMEVYRRYKDNTTGYYLDNGSIRKTDLTEAEYKVVYEQQLIVEKEIEELLQRKIVGWK